MSNNRKLPLIPDKTLPVVKSATGVKSTKPRSTQAVARGLKKLKFNPLSQLINGVYPNLSPEDQAKVCLKLMEYQFPRLKAEDAEGRKKKGSTIQINTQVNVPNNEQNQQVHSEQKPSLQELLKAAQVDHAGEAK